MSSFLLACCSGSHRSIKSCLSGRRPSRISTLQVDCQRRRRLRPTCLPRHPFLEADRTSLSTFLTQDSSKPKPIVDLSDHGSREAGGRSIPRPGRRSRLLPRSEPAGGGGAAACVRPSFATCGGPARRVRARGDGRQGRRRRSGGRRKGCGGRAGGGGARGAEAVGAADVPGGRGDVQPRDHVHGRRRRLLPLRLANGGRRDPGDGDVRHLRAFGGRRGGNGVLGAVGAPGAVARVAVAHARVAPPAARRALRAQRRVRHRQRRPRHVAPRLRLLQPGSRPRPLLRRGAGDYAVRDGVHVRPRRPRPPPLPRGPHRERALLPPGRRRPSVTSHGQV